MLAADQVESGYGRKKIVFDASLTVDAGEVVSLVGHNGAGKTTLLKTLCGILPVQSGRISFDGADICGESCRRIVARGLSLVPSERFVFADLTVADNLRLGAGRNLSRSEWQLRLEQVYSLFPLLEERPAAKAQTLSGGQQRMLSMGMALMRAPRLLLLDEPSLGLAPAVVGKLFETVRALADGDGTAILLVEQNLPQAFAISDRVCVMRAGRIIADSPASSLRERTDYWDIF